MQSKPEGPPNEKVGKPWPRWLIVMTAVGLSLPFWSSLIVGMWYAVAPW